MGNWRIGAALLLWLVQLPLVLAQQGGEVVQVKGRISDHANVVGASQEHLLYQMLMQYEFDFHQRVVVVSVETTGSESVEAYAERCWQAWRYDSKGKGVLLLLSKQQRSAAIVAGEALRGKLNSTAVAKLIDENIATHLAQGDFDSAAMEGVKGILAVLSR